MVGGGYGEMAHLQPEHRVEDCKDRADGDDAYDLRLGVVALPHRLRRGHVEEHRVIERTQAVALGVDVNVLARRVRPLSERVRLIAATPSSSSAAAVCAIGRGAAILGVHTGRAARPVVVVVVVGFFGRHLGLDLRGDRHRQHAQEVVLDQSEHLVVHERVGAARRASKKLLCALGAIDDRL